MTESAAPPARRDANEPPAAESATGVHARGLGFRYPGARRPALTGVDLEVRAGEVVGLLGPSGAGKSTLVKVLIGRLPGYTGSVMVLGKPPSVWGRDLYRHIGVSFELPNHFVRLSAAENLRFAASLYGRSGGDPPMRSTDEVLDAVGLLDSADEPVAAFSKGMRLRLNLARALLHRPRLLFLDEPTSGLDPATARRVQALVLRLRDEGATVVVTTHQMQLADAVCDRVGFVVDGALVAMDAPRALRLAHGVRELEVEVRRRGGELDRRRFPLAALGGDDLAGWIGDDPVETVHSREVTLDTVFVRVTGRVLTGTEGEGAPDGAPATDG